MTSIRYGIGRALAGRRNDHLLRSRPPSLLCAQLIPVRTIVSNRDPFRQRNSYHRQQQQRQSQQPIWQTRGFWYCAGAAGTAGTVYYELHVEESPTGRRRFINVSPEYERQIGQQAYLQTLAQYRGRIVAPGSTSMDRDVRRVAKRVVAATGMDKEDWQVHVIYAPEEKNAFVLPGGKIFVFSGLLSLTKDDDGLATVLAHEIAHQYARHSAEKLSQASLLSFIYIVASLFIDPSYLQLGSAMSTLLLELPNSRQCEMEADQLGLYFMASACYDPAQAVALWQRMRAAETVAPPQFLNTHPSTDSRIESIRDWVPQAEMKREAANCPTRELTQSFFSSLGSPDKVF